MRTIFSIAQAETEAATGDLTKDRFKELFDETLKRLGQSLIERISVKGWFDSWLATRPAPDDPDAVLFPSLADKPLNGTRGLSNAFVKLCDILLQNLPAKLKKPHPGAGASELRDHLDHPRRGIGNRSGKNAPAPSIRSQGTQRKGAH